MVIQLDVLVEEPSAEQALRVLLPKLVGGRARTKVITFPGKGGMLKALESRLNGYRTRVERGEDVRVLVLVDRDTDDCVELKSRLERAAAAAGLATKSNPAPDNRFRVVNRVVIEELESWFVGDPAALRKAFARLPAIDERRGLFRNPENGGSWKALHRFLRNYGIYKGTYPKIEAARRIATHMDIDRNRAQSFRHFVSGVHAILA